MDLSREYRLQRQGLLYPLMVIAAIAVIVFSILGIATISGWVPSTMQGTTPAGAAPAGGSTPPVRNEPRAAAPILECAECGVIDAVRHVENATRETTAAVPAQITLATDR